MNLTDKQRQFLNEVHFAVVATIAPNGMPHQTVMWYMLNGDQLLLNTPRDSLKHKHLKRDPRISVCVEKAYTYVTLTGRVTLDEDPTRARADYQSLQERYLPTLNSTSTPSRQNTSAGGRRRELLSRRRVTLHMAIDKIHSNGLD
jgi:PPOX class probable F420-dependent enzyme